MRQYSKMPPAGPTESAISVAESWCVVSLTVRQDNAFGKDIGLIHEAIVTGRKVGAGKNFWAMLAHDEDFFHRVVELTVERSKVETFIFEVNYNNPRWKTIDFSTYAYVGDAKAEDYLVTRTGRKRVTCRYLSYDHHAMDDEVLADMEREKCSQPDRPITETFVSLNPGEPKKYPVIGRTGSLVRRNGEYGRAYVDAGLDGVSLRWHWVSLRWHQIYRFLVVCKVEDL